ncbi:MAG: DUF4923 family protein [Sodaliphilus sp.]|nr:DUF4923 family protein [Sodaliphilus sp.]
MKRLLVTAAIATLLAVGTGAAREQTDSAVVAAEQSASTESCKAIAGTWQYQSPAVDAKGKNIISKLGTPIAKSKIKKKLGKAFDKLKLKSLGMTMELQPDGNYSLHLPGHDIGGRYTYDAASEQITLYWHHLPLKARLVRKGKKECRLLFDTDKLLYAAQLLSTFSQNPAVKMLSALSSNYTDVMVGFSLKRR